MRDRQRAQARARRFASIAAINLVFFTLGAARAHAQSAEAEALFIEAERLLGAGKIAQACEAFEGSNKIEPTAGTLVRLGQCREQMHQLASAWSAYKDALARVKDPAKRAFALERSAEIEPKLSYLTIAVPDESRVDGLTISQNGKPVDRVLWNRAAPIDGGDYVITVHAPGNEDWTATVTVPIERGKVTVDVPKLEELGKLAEGGGRPPGTFTTKRKIAIGVATVSAASLVTAIVLGTSANGKENDAFALCPDPQMPCTNANRAHDLTVSGHRLAMGANIMFGAAGVAAIGAGILWFTGAPESPRRLAVIPSARSISVVGWF
jgi:hypothetical protein